MVVEIKNLVKKYKELTALDDFNLEVKEGEIYGLLGPNGSGKTTCINCILSLVDYDNGSVKIFGKDMSPTAYDIKKDIGIVMQNVAVFEELTVYENINYFCGLYITNKEERKKLVDEAIAFVALEDFKNFYPKKLSGGLLRRLNIACGVAHKPKLIILDEPTVAVDPQSRNKILEGIKELNANGATIIYTTHYMEEAEELCTKITIMDKGKAIATGTKNELKSMIEIGEKVTIELILDDKTDTTNLEEISKLEGVESVNINKNIITIESKPHTNILANVIEYITKAGIKYSRIYSELPTLKDVFLEMTGRKLRD